MKKIINNSTNPFDIRYRVIENDFRKGLDFNFSHTQHSNKRSCQRGINKDKIIIALEYGKATFKQGLLYYVLGEKDIPAHLQQEKNKFMNIVVIVSGDSNEIVTCYRSKNAVKNIKLKPKELRKYLKCA
jgi:hypothetical protein